jgi:hypothetical protein
MMFPLTLGRDSSGNLHHIDLEEVPILFLSYISEEQLSSIYMQLNKNDYNYLVTTSKRIERWGFDRSQNHVFIRDDPEKGSVQSRGKLLKLVSKTIQSRKRALRRFKTSNFKEYGFSLPDKRKEKFGCQFLLIDDIWDMVISKPKQLALNLILTILEGPSVGIYSIIGSGLSYRNLLEQLISRYPTLSEELQKKFGNPPPRTIDQISHELIFTSEDLIYFKKANSMELQKFYKV